MQQFLAALAYWAGFFAFIALPTWVSSPAPAQPSVRVVYACPPAHVCFPVKDEARVAATSALPPNVFTDARAVSTQSFRAADITPAQQAAENRKRKVAKR